MMAITLDDLEEQELQLLENRRKAREFAASADSGPSIGELIASGVAGLGTAMAGGNGAQMAHGLLDSNRKRRIERDQLRLKALDRDTATLKQLVDLQKTRSESARKARESRAGQQEKAAGLVGKGFKPTLEDGYLAGFEADPGSFVSPAQAEKNKETRAAMIAAGQMGRMQSAQDFAAQQSAIKRQFDAQQSALDRKNRETKDLKGAASELRKEYLGLPTTKQTQDVVAAFERVKSAAGNPSPASDISLIFNYMKMLDPGSTVREGEFATAQQAASFPTQVVNAYHRAIQGTRLSPEQRQDFLASAGHSYDAQLAAQSVFEGRYSDLAKQAGVDPGQILIPFQKRQAAGGRTPVKTFRNKRTGKIKTLYSDGTEEIK
jgi:hypothetical protein